jgi:hypothetical protein
MNSDLMKLRFYCRRQTFAGDFICRTISNDSIGHFKRRSSPYFCIRSLYRFLFLLPLFLFRSISVRFFAILNLILRQITGVWEIPSELKV